MIVRVSPSSVFSLQTKYYESWGSFIISLTQLHTSQIAFQVGSSRPGVAPRVSAPLWVTTNTLKIQPVRTNCLADRWVTLVNGGSYGRGKTSAQSFTRLASAKLIFPRAAQEAARAYCLQIKCNQAAMNKKLRGQWLSVGWSLSAGHCFLLRSLVITAGARANAHVSYRASIKILIAAVTHLTLGCITLSSFSLWITALMSPVTV